MDFIKQNKIDLVVHGFSNEADREKQKDFYAEINKNGYFKEIEYYIEDEDKKKGGEKYGLFFSPINKKRNRE